MLVVVLLLVAVALLVLGVVLETTVYTLVGLGVAVLAGALLAHLMRSRGVDGPVTETEASGAGKARAGKPAEKSASATSATAKLGEKPTAEKPAAGKPAAEKPAAGKLAAEKPAAGKPAAEKPAAGKPAAEKPAAGKPAAEKPAAGKPKSGAAKTVPSKPASGTATTAATTAPETSSPAPGNGGDTGPTGDDVVHVARGRRRFHRSGCSMLDERSHEEITIAEAEAEGFTSCTLCAPQHGG